MKYKTKKIGILLITLLVIGFVFPLFENKTLDLGVEETTFNNLKISQVYSGIEIDALATTNTTYSGNWTWAVSQSWCYIDNGVYIIEDLTINASTSPTGSGILINNSKNDYFIIRNCKVYDAADGGITLQNTKNGTLTNNNCSNNGYGIYLYLNSDNNTISGNTANYNGESGIYLLDGGNNTISENTANDNNRYGIFLDQSENNTISGNIVSNNITTDQRGGIYLLTNCDYNTISGNTANDNDYGIYLLTNCDYNTISGNTANDNTYEGILLEDNCNNNIISGNTANNNTGYGIYLYQLCDNNTISGNTANYNYIGIYLEESCMNNTISGNTLNDNTDSGIYLLTNCDYNTISGNTANDNTYEGILLEDNCNNNTISGNTANNNPNSGIYLGDSDYNTILGNNLKGNMVGIWSNNGDNNDITGNTANGNEVGLGGEHGQNNTVSGNTVNDNTWGGIQLSNDFNYNTITGNTANDNDDTGIYISNNCKNNTISGNTANNNGNYGINMKAALNNTIKGNKVSNNFLSGIYLDDACDYNEISENIIYNNTIGIDIDDLNDDNSLYKNFFLKNGKHASDDGTDNNWNSTTIGNYWDNHTGPDGNDDGIVDTQYNISGTPGSIDYLPIAEDGAPTITINSPDPGDVFDSTALSFNVRITEDYLDETWYTIDGGLTNYTFTTNGTIDQTAWGMTSEGSVTITFYASDIPRNIGIAEVIIVKDYEAPVININSPTTGEYLGSNAPSFNVRITDDYLDTMWYTLDGGLNNNTFTPNGTLDQSAWNAVADGAVILKFYANDTLGHIGSAEVSIIKDATAPLIIINSPVEGDKFGKNAPLFNITITEVNLDSISYSFDGGVTTHPITDGTIFNQTAWTALAQGNVTITFYARDLAGNEASESVTVVKSVPSGLDPGVTITIVVVSVVGGVAVIAGVYVFMKKRVSPT